MDQALSGYGYQDAASTPAHKVLLPTLEQLLREQGLEVLSFDRVGRIAPLAMSMFMVARSPAAA